MVQYETFDSHCGWDETNIELVWIVVHREFTQDWVELPSFDNVSHER